MADANDSATPPVEQPIDQTAPVEAPVAETEVVETPVVETPTPTPAAPAPIVHDPIVLAEARGLGITAEFAASMSPAELYRTTLLLAKQRAGQGRSPQAQEAPAPEQDFALPAEMKAKVAEFDPNLVGFVEEASKLAARAGIERAKKAEQQLAQVQQEQATREFGRQVETVFSSIPGLGAGTVRPGSKEHAKREAIKFYLGTLQQGGQDPGPPEVAIPMANAILFGGDAAPAPAAKPARPSATPTARPTNRLGAREDDNSEDAIVARWDAWKRDEEKKALNGSTNGDFVP